MSQRIEQPPVLTERRGYTMLVTINRPEVRNAVNLAVWCGIGEALEEADRDTEVRAVIITGAGDQSFCAGADLKAIARGEDVVPSEPRKLAWGFAGIAEHAISKPVIAAVNGSALGGGTEIALAADLIVAAETATFGFPEVTVGFIAGAGGIFRLVDQIPRKLAMELILSGKPITAARALELGLVNRIVPRADVVATAFELAELIAGNAPLAVQASKRIARGVIDGKFKSEEEAWALSHREMAKVLQSADASEGPRSFAEKRAPRWQGR